MTEIGVSNREIRINMCKLEVILRYDFDIKFSLQHKE